MIVHLTATIINSQRTACGKILPDADVRVKVDIVSCKRCINTVAFKMREIDPRAK